MALSIRQKRVRRISGDPVHGVVDGLATGTPLYSVAVQGTIDGRTTCRPRAKGLEVWYLECGRYKLWWKGDDGTGGVGVMVREELVEKVLEVRRRSNGVIVVVMVFGKVIVRVISGYAPQQSRKEEEKDRFYDDVSDEIGQAGLDEFVVLLGDLNGHVGADADGYEGVHGGWGYGIRNEEGRRVLELADAHSMMVGNTWFTRKPAQLITYRSGEHRSMIDYILVRAKHRKYVKNVKAIPGERRWESNGVSLIESYNLFWNGQKTAQNGVGIFIRESLAQNVLEVTRISLPLMLIKLRMGKQVLTVFSAYAPQTSKSEDPKNDFWNTLSGAIRKTPSSEIPLICDNLNGHVGDKANGFHGVTGGFGYGSQNEDGVRILEFAENHELSFLNIYFKKRAKHLIIYKSGMSCTKIDFIVVRQHHRRLFRNAKMKLITMKI
ncbi:hypothetical protein HELRODRAFT_179020 [Helobdella robusta]|uniref:Endonuclease/exonuclease/phosphatase domain-containing protein n=1 Tax=Helobdella robusta TaxID=6412 RepID=T1FE25_HELRO|nr:hypothetical protein HELRODRAFT_179020 [Helobdella robusta]ESN95833.1 hypothetical protein HELRODRAFT_179020 [Helobdella robusta]